MNQAIKFSLYCRKFHRFLILFSVITFSVMAKTGLIIRYRWWMVETPTGSVMKIWGLTIPETYLRQLHSNYSLYFTIVIGLMMITGLVMYVVPKWLVWRNKKPASPESQS